MKKFILLNLLGLIVATSAYAQIDVSQIDVSKLQQKTRDISDKEFNLIDKNHDKAISKQEYLDYVMRETIKKNEAAFNSIDQNKDGKVSKQEYEDFMNFATEKMNDFFKMMKK